MRVWKSAVAAVGAVLVAGCGGVDSQGNETPGHVRPHYVSLPDGSEVLCVFEKAGYGGGLSCDWAGKKR